MPVQAGGVPIYIGGDNVRAFERLARFGAGWYALALTPEQLSERLEILRPILERHGRKLDNVEILLCPYTLGDRADDLRRYQDAGVTQLLLMTMAGDPDQLVRRIERAAALADTAGFTL